MFPLLFKVGPIPVHTYGLMIAIGFMVSVSVVRRLSIKNQLDSIQTADFAFWILLVGFLGARSLFVATRFSEYLANPLDVFKIWEGGLVFYGGPLFALPFGIWLFWKNKISGWKGIDVFLPAVAIAHALGRLGCLAAGCCYGRPTTLPWGIRLNSELVDLSHRGVSLHPVQLYESVALVILFFGLMWVSKHKKFDGQVGLIYLLGYPVIRMIVETFRGDLIRGFVVDQVLSTSQFISLIVFIVALGAFLFRVRSATIRSKS